MAKTALDKLLGVLNADERSRTSTGRSPQAPEACASANSATSASVQGYTVGTEYRVGPPFCQAISTVKMKNAEIANSSSKAKDSAIPAFDV